MAKVGLNGALAVVPVAIGSVGTDHAVEAADIALCADYLPTPTGVPAHGDTRQ